MAKQIKDTIKIDNKKLLITGVLITLIAAGSGIIYSKKKKNKQLKKRDITGQNSGFCRYSDKYPLKIGSCGANVTKLQKKLVLLGIFIGNSGVNSDGVDGKFGRQTQIGVKKAIGRSTINQQDIRYLSQIIAKDKN